MVNWKSPNRGFFPLCCYYDFFNFESNSTFYINFTNIYHLTYIQIMDQPVVHFVILMSDLPWQQKKSKSTCIHWRLYLKWCENSIRVRTILRAAATHTFPFYILGLINLYVLWKAATFGADAQKIFRNMHENCVISHIDNLDHFFDF